MPQIQMMRSVAKKVFDHEENFFSTHHLKHPDTTSFAPTKALQTTQHLPNNTSPTDLFAAEKPACSLVASINSHQPPSQC